MRHLWFIFQTPFGKDRSHNSSNKNAEWMKVFAYRHGSTFVANTDQLWYPAHRTEFCSALWHWHDTIKCGERRKERNIWHRKRQFGRFRWIINEQRGYKKWNITFLRLACESRGRIHKMRKCRESSTRLWARGRKVWFLGQNLHPWARSAMVAPHFEHNASYLVCWCPLPVSWILISKCS